MTITPPANLEYATITHRLLRTLVDTGDVDRFPDVTAANDATVTITPALTQYKNLALPATFIQTVHRGHYDTDGFLRDEQNNLGIVVVAPDSDQISPQGWQYNVQISAAGTTFPAFKITVQGGQTYDLTLVSPAVPSVPVVTIVSDESRVKAEVAAIRAENAVASINTDIGNAVEAYLDANPPQGGGGSASASDGSVSVLIEDANSQTRAAINTVIATFNYVTNASFTAGLAGKANTVHTHTITNVTGLQAALDGKSAVGHGHVTADITNFNASVDSRIDLRVAGAPAALDTLDELAAALGDDPNFAGTITLALANRVRHDAAQTLTTTQQGQARSNIGAVSQSELTSGLAGKSDTTHNHDARYVRTVNNTGPDEAGNVSVSVGSGGTSDHGALEGLSDDDHPQYHNDTRGDARYYTKAQSDSALSTGLATKAATGHTHTMSAVTDAATYVDGRIETRLGVAPAALDTLTEIAARIQSESDDTDSVVASLTAQIAGKAPTVHTHAGTDVTQASTTVRGTSRLATNTETTTGTATDLATTPAGVKAVGDTKAPLVHTHAVADTTGLQTALDGKASTTVVNAIDTRLTAQETFPRIYVVDALPSSPPVGSRTDDVYIVRGSGTVAPPPAAMRQLLLTGMAEGSFLKALDSTGVGSTDNQLDAVSSASIPVNINGSGVRRVHITGTNAVTYRWSTNFPSTAPVSVEIDIEPVAHPTAATTFFQATGWARLSLGTTSTVTVLNNAGTAATSSVGGSVGAASPAMTLGAGIYKIKGWLPDVATGTLSVWKIYNPDGTTLWGPVNRDCGVGPVTTVIYGRTGNTGGDYYLSGHRVDDTNVELS